MLFAPLTPRIRLFPLLGGLIALLQGLTGCASPEVRPVPPPVVPEYLQVTHPTSTDLSDLDQVIRDPECPSSTDFLEHCDLAFRQLYSSTVSQLEREQGTRELVRGHPTHYHWCFYRKLQALEQQLQDTPLLEERQKKVLFLYSFLGPIARAFLQEYQDSRYLRFASHRYQDLSQWLFDKTLVLSPEGTVQLVQPENPFGLWKKDVTSPETPSLVQKYSLIDPTEKPPIAPSLPATPPPTPFNLSPPGQNVSTGPQTPPPPL